MATNLSFWEGCNNKLTFVFTNAETNAPVEGANCTIEVLQDESGKTEDTPATMSDEGDGVYTYTYLPAIFTTLALEPGSKISFRIVANGGTNKILTLYRRGVVQRYIGEPGAS